jgi:hypothetical protein
MALTNIISVPLFLLSVFCIILSMSACTAGTAATPGGVRLVETQTGGNLARLQQAGNLTGFLSGYMNFKISGTEFAFPTQLTVDQVPIYWMKTIFNGKVEKAGPGEDLTDEVHGSLSEDGDWVESMYYGEQITRPSSKTATFFRVTLRHVPLQILNGPADKEIGVFNLSNGDLQKYVEKIEYRDGPWNNGQITPLSEYLSIDWNNTERGKVPVLRLTFAEGSGNRPAPGSNPGGPGGM